MRTLLSTLSLALFALTSTAQIGSNCESQAVLRVGTGWDPVSNSVITTPLQPDPMWSLIQAPPPPSMWPITLGGPAFVIPTASGWALPGSNCTYINAFATNTAVQDNWDTTIVPYIFEREFCICDPEGQGNSFPVTFDLKLNADNWAEVILVHPGGLQQLLLAQPFVYTTNNFTNPPHTALVTHNLTPGTYRLHLYLRNKLVTMGVALDGTLTSPGLLADSACVDGGIITGYKYKDVDQNGVVSGSDTPVPGWVIQLFDSGGNLISSQTTDFNGYYFFSGLAPGTYTVTEVPQAGWVMVNPASGSQTVVVSNLGVTQADFLNDMTVVGQGCDFDLNFDVQVERCGATFTPSITGIPAGYQVVSTVWTFGDGYSSNELMPTHFYNAAGAYTACLEVTIFDGKECCTKTLCRDFGIDEPCEDDCNIEADIDIQFDERNCSYDFSAVINYTGVPIVNWFWDFGDGTTGNGSTITHQFPAPGSYNVCLTLFGRSRDGEDCCFRTICQKVNVDCDPCKGEALKMRGDEGAASDVQLFPNPSTGNFNLMVDLSRRCPGNPKHHRSERQQRLRHFSWKRYSRSKCLRN